MNAIFGSVRTVPIWVFPIRASIVYLALILATRLSGRRGVATLDPYSFIVAVTVGSLASPPMVDPKASVIAVIVTIFALYTFQIVLYLLEGRSPVISKLVGDEPLVLVENGKVVEDNLMKAHYNLDNLFMQLRLKHAPNLQDVEFAVLEPSGGVAVVKKSQARPVTREDLGLQAKGGGWARIVIADGVINTENLAMTGHDEEWILDQLRTKGIDDIKKVLVMMVDRQDNVYVDYIRPSQFSLAR